MIFCLEYFRYFDNRLSAEEHFEYMFYYLCFFGDDLGFAVDSFLVAEELLIHKGNLAFFEVLSERPCDVLTDVLRFALCETCVDDEVKLAVALEGVDVLFFEEHTDSHGFEHSHVFKAVDRVSCESGYRFRDDVIDFAFLAVFDHAVKLVTLLGLCA